MPEPIDILEDKLYQQEPKLLKTLLIDRTTQKNIFWATDSYTDNGEGYQRHDQLTEEAITGVHGKIIMPRALKKKGRAATTFTKNGRGVYTFVDCEDDE